MIKFFIDKLYSEELTDKDVVDSLLDKVSAEDMKTLRVMVEHFIRES
jgi:hypothetical protein